MSEICLDGRILPADEPALRVDNRGYRYGDGLFETMKVYEERILLASFHFERFFSGLRLLEIEIPVHLTAEKLTEHVLQLCGRNKCAGLARVRLSAFRGHGGPYDGDVQLHYVIEAWPLRASIHQLNENGVVMGIYPEARKSCDLFSALKSANYLPYIMGAQYAKHRQWNDSLILNTEGRVADTTISNIFIIKGKRIMTPPLSEGPVEGVMRRHLLESCPGAMEKALTIEEMMEADEIFLTNAISGIRWVGECQGKRFGREETVLIFNEHVLDKFKIKK
jgi:branched-chain amino acid aminotransferase